MWITYSQPPCICCRRVHIVALQCICGIVLQPLTQGRIALWRKTWQPSWVLQDS